MKFLVAGVQFRPAGHIKMVSSALKEGDYFQLVPEPTNKFDPNAVRIEYNVDTGDEIKGIHIGYVPKRFSAEVSAMLMLDSNVLCIARAVNAGAKPWEMFLVEVFRPEPEPEEEDSDGE